jgi:hypothetical protein
MSKLIVEMEMPIGCANCPMADDDSRFCKATKKYIPMLCKPSWCPIVCELPEQHGDLIDRDEIKTEMLKRMPMLCMTTSGDNPVVCTRQEILHLISHAEAVIAAERKDDDD